MAGASRYLGRVHINLTSDRFLTITRSTDEWAKSIVSIVDLGTPDSAIKVTRFDVFPDTFELCAEVTKCAVDPTGKYCVVYGKLTFSEGRPFIDGFSELLSYVTVYCYVERVTSCATTVG